MPRAPRRITAARLQRITAHYLERYTSSRANLRRLLMRRVYRAAEHHGDDVAVGASLVDLELDRLEAAGQIDDARYAADRARSLQRRGASTRKIRAALAAKGIRGPDIDAALAALDSNAELSAACTFARKRRLGPWRTREVDPDTRRRELGRMARAGFTFDLAQRVVDAEDVDALLCP